MDQNLEVDQRPTEDPKSISRPREKNRTGDSALRRKPGTRPQAGSRGNFLSPQKVRGQVTTEVLRSVSEEDETRPHLQYPSTSSPRARGRFSPSTKAPNKVRQFHIRPSKAPFTTRRPLRPTSPPENDEIDGLEVSDSPVEDSAHPSDISKVPERPADISGVSVHPSDSLKISEPPTDSSEISKNPEYSSDVSLHQTDSLKPSVYPPDSSKVSEHTADTSEVPIHPADNLKVSGAPEGSSEFSEHREYSSDTSIHQADSSKAPTHHADRFQLYDSEVIHNEGNQQHVAENSTLTPDSNETTSMLQGDQGDNTLLVQGHTDSTDIEYVMTTLRDEPTTMSEGDRTPEQLIHRKENNSNTYEVLTMNPGHTLVEEDNFRGFVDSVLIDTTDSPQVFTVSEETVTEEPLDETTLTPQSFIESTMKPAGVPIITTSTFKTSDASAVIRQASEHMGISTVTTVDSRPLGVSVVTTKSVINGTMFAVPSVAPPILEQMATPVSAKGQPELTHPTESWVVVASVQTSRSVSGARFLPSSAVKQEERPQSLSGKTIPSSKPTHSTESIIDKLYRVESDLSSGILTGGLRPEGKKLQLEVLTDMTDTNTTTSTPTSTTTYKSPVFIRKFLPHSNRTTPKPNKLAVLFDSIPMDDLSHLLPPGFKQRHPTSRRTTTPSTKYVETVDYPQGDEPVKPNITSSRSSGFGSAKNKIRVEDGSSVGKPPKKLEDLFSRVKFDDVRAFLPPEYNLSTEDRTSTTAKPRDVDGLFSKAKPVDVSSFLPPGFKLPVEERTSTTSKPRGVEALLSKAQAIDVSAFLPPGFKLTTTTQKSDPESLRDVGTLLPSGVIEENSTIKVTTSVDMLRGKFPTRPGVTRKPLASTRKPVQGPGVLKPKISSGWPTR